jgi:hypothetical protein
MQRRWPRLSTTRKAVPWNDPQKAPSHTPAPNKPLQRAGFAGR